jgi:Branched-chain amino acid transport protein (AzlD)
MSASLDDGYGGYLVLLAICVIAHEPWRWLGFVLGRNLRADSEMFLWVRAVATALVSGLVMKLVVFPAGTLATVPLWVRIVALVAGLVAYGVGRSSLALGVAGASATLVALQLLRAAL